MTTEEIQEYIHMHQPVAAYLGRREMDAFRAEMLAVHAPTRSSDAAHIAYGPRAIYANTPIYEVATPSHVGFGKDKED